METIKKSDLEKILQQANNLLIELLTDATIYTVQMAIARERANIMNLQWKSSKKSQELILTTYGGTVPSWEHKRKKMLQWYESASTTAAEKVAYETTTSDRLSRHELKGMEHYMFAAAWAHSKENFFRWYRDQYTGVTTIWEANPLIPKLTMAIRDEFRAWFERQIVTESLLNQSSKATMSEFLHDRPDIIVLLNIISRLPNTKSVSQGSIERPVAVEATELALSLVPILGNGIALYEVWAGHDLFGYELSGVEQAILAASVLLPVAGRLVKGGKALYTEARLVSLYGKDATAWGRVVSSSARAGEQRAAIRSIEGAEEALLKLGRVEGKLAQEAASAVKSVVRSPGSLSSAVAQDVKVLWTTLSNKYLFLRNLDEIALNRVLRKGPNVDHLKGQLLEELTESHIVPMLRQRHAAFALGVEVPKGKTLEFIPGHSILDSSGRQLTDGVIGYLDNDVLNIVAIFESKAGRKGARELTVTKSNVSRMSKADLLELKAAAKDFWLDAKELAERKGDKFSKSVTDYEQELLAAKDTGQLRRDIERLSQNAGAGLTKIFVGGVEHAVRISPTTTKFFGVVPKGVRTNLLEAEARAAGFRFEALAVPIHRKELEAMAKELVPLATQMAQKPL